VADQHHLAIHLNALVGTGFGPRRMAKLNRHSPRVAPHVGPGDIVR
jgi:hypothetical protein